MAPTATRTKAWQGFGPGLLGFLCDLETHNDRDWFQANKKRYEEQVKGPCLAFVEDIEDPLGSVSPHLVADPRPVGGSMSRIHRDTRFSKDKSPYHTHVSLRFGHRDAKKEWGGPFCYVRLAPGGTFAAAGVKGPGPEALAKIRDAITADADGWGKAKKGLPALEGGALKRPPQGYSADHPCIEDLKRKDFVTSVRFSDAQVASPDFMDACIDGFRRLAPLGAFTARALDLRW